MLRRIGKAAADDAASPVDQEDAKSTPRLSRGLKLYLLCAILAVAAVSTLALFTVAPTYLGKLSTGALSNKKSGGKSNSGKGKPKVTPSPSSVPNLVVAGADPADAKRDLRGAAAVAPKKAAPKEAKDVAVDTDLEDRPPVFSDAELDGLGDNDTSTSDEAAAAVPDAGAAAAPAADEDEAPHEFTHDDDPVPAVGHDEVHRPFGGRGCTFKLCNKQAKGASFNVGGQPSAELPLMYVIVPHRNRVDNIVRLLTSINNATTPAQRACMCILLTDFNTTTAVIPPWKNVHCLVSFREKHGIYMDDEAYTPPKELKKGDLKKAMMLAAKAGFTGPQPCPRIEIDRQSLKAPGRGAWGSVTEHFPPAHLDVAGLTGRQAVRHALAFYDGESAIIDGNKYVKDAKIKFSRAGGIMAGIDAIQTPPERSLVFICDADMIIRPGFAEDMVRVPVPAKTAFLPIIWSMCWGAALEDGPKRSNWRSSRKGFWRPGGRGMVVAYLSDIKAVGGMR